MNPNTMTLKQLRALAATAGIAGRSKMTKAQLVDALAHGDAMVHDADVAAATAPAPMVRNQLDAPAQAPGADRICIFDTEGFNVKPTAAQFDLYRGIRDQDGWEVVTLTVQGDYRPPRDADLILRALERDQAAGEAFGAEHPWTPAVNLTIAQLRSVARELEVAGIDAMDQHTLMDAVVAARCAQEEAHLQAVLAKPLDPSRRPVGDPAPVATGGYADAPRPRRKKDLGKVRAAMMRRADYIHRLTARTAELVELATNPALAFDVGAMAARLLRMAEAV